MESGFDKSAASMSCNLNFHQNQDDLLPKPQLQENGHVAKRRRLETNPLDYGNILERIFFCSAVDSIKAARLVNPLWNAEGVKMLIQKCYVKIPSDLRNAESSTKDQKMNEFKAFLAYKSSQVFKIPNISIHAAADADLWKLLEVSQQVNSLKLHIMDDNADLLQDSLKLLPNLTHLNFEGCQNLSDKQNCSIIKVLGSFLSTLKMEGKPLIVSFKTLEIGSLEDLEDLETLSECKSIMFEKMQFSLMSPLFMIIPRLESRVTCLFSKLMKTSQNILINLTLLCYDDPYTQYRFSPGFRFSEAVPKLAKILLSVDYLDQGLRANFYENLFKNTGPAPSVKHLAYCADSCSAYNLGPLFQTFPNLENVTSRNSDKEQIRKIFEPLCKHAGNSMRWLYFIIDVDQNAENVAELDSIFTGFSPETVDKMKESLKMTSCSLEELEKLRVNPSILDLKALESLTITLRGNGQNLSQGILAFAGEHAFKYMPSKIYIDVKNCNPSPECMLPFLEHVLKLPNVAVFPGRLNRFEQKKCVKVNSCSII